MHCNRKEGDQVGVLRELHARGELFLVAKKLLTAIFACWTRQTGSEKKVCS